MYIVHLRCCRQLDIAFNWMCLRGKLGEYSVFTLQKELFYRIFPGYSEYVLITFSQWILRYINDVVFNYM